MTSTRRTAAIHTAPATLYRRLPWFAVLVSLSVILSGLFAVSPIRDAATLQDVSDVTLARPIGYVVLAPLSAVLDMLTLLSRNQHIALVIGCLMLFAAWRAYRGWCRAAGLRDHLGASLVFLVALIALYTATALLPRPMAALVTEDANVLRIDFHSHTSASPDARSSWTAERNRAWHGAGGYDVAYLTDHRDLTDAERTVVRNPMPAGAGVTLLPAIEVRAGREHIAMLGARRIYTHLLAANGDAASQVLQRPSLAAEREPLVILNHPRVLDQLPIASGAVIFDVRAMELSNGAPGHMDDQHRNRMRIVSTAQSRNLMLTSGSDSHGWGNTAPNWTLLTLLNWRSLSSDALAAHIESLVRGGGNATSRVIERRAADVTSPVTLALTVFAAPARMLTTLSTGERVAWLAWIALFLVAKHFVRRSRL